MNNILTVELSGKNIAGLILAVIAIFVMFFAKKIAENLTNKKFGSNSVVRNSDEEKEEGWQERLKYEKKRYYDNVFLLTKLAALVVAIVCALVALL